MSEQSISRAKIDWERIEVDYRAGILTLREIASRDGNVTEGAIRKRAKLQGWIRDLSVKIRERADELVRKESVRKLKESVRNEQIIKKGAAYQESYKEIERQTIDAIAESIAEIRIVHRKDINRHRALTVALLAELESQTGDNSIYKDLGEILRSDDGDKRMDIYNRVISSPGRIDSLKKLADTLKTLIGLERQAYDIGEVAGGDSAGSINISF